MSGLTTKQLPDEQTGKGSQKERHHGLLQTGSVLQDRYRIEGTRGIGGFSSVYQARDMHFRNVTRLCAVKEMVHSSHDERVRKITTESFEREASILATMDHPAIPDVYDFFSEGDRSYLVLEYIHGEDLEDMLNKSTDFFQIDVVFDWAVQLCDVLAYLHSHQPHPVIFRDLKPSNVMLDRHKRIRLIDFNIAKLFQTGVKGTMIGTEGYSPPEQYRGESSPAGDVYALGATLHHVLSRQDPRVEPPFSFAERPLQDANDKMPLPFQSIIERCLAYDVKQRYEDASAVKEALVRIAPSMGLGGNTTGLGQSGFVAPSADAHPGTPNLGGVAPLWKFRCEDEIRSTPEEADGIVYVGAYDHNLYAIGAETGDFLWKYPSTDGIASSPHVYKDMILIGSSDGYIYSLNRNSGRLNWRFETGGPVYSSPRADFDHVFIGSDDGHLYALNMTTGREVWRSAASSSVRSTPMISDDRIYYGADSGYLFCLDLAGKVKWQFRARRAITASPVFAEDMIFIGSMDSTIYAVDANSGWAIWRFRSRRPIVSTAAIDGNRAYFGSSDGTLYALDIFSGRRIWTFETEGQINSSPAIWEDAIYFGCTDGNVYSLETKRGKVRWAFRTGGMVVGSPTIVDGVVYIGSCDGHVYALPT